MLPGTSRGIGKSAIPTRILSLKATMSLLRDCLDTANQLSRMLRGLEGKDCDVEQFSSSVELCRSALSRLERRSELLHEAVVKTWTTACLDMLQSITGQLQGWQHRGVMETSLLDPRSRKGLEVKINHLSAHFQVLRSMLRNSKASARGQPEADRSALEEELAGLINVANMIDDKEGLAWWETHFGQRTYTVSWDQFREALVAPDEGRQISEREFAQLKATLDHARSDIVTAHQWGSFLLGFGPGIMAAIEQMQGTMLESWFAGFLSYDEAEEVLRQSQPGAFLVRFSASQPCGFAIAFKSVSNEIKQIIVRARSSAGGFELNGQTFGSLRDVIESKPALLKFPAPALKTISQAMYFKGFISFDESKELLKNEPPGTFLFRFSRSDPGALAVAYVSESGEVLQSKVFCEPESGGYKLGNGVYTSLSDLIRYNHKRLKYPHGGSAPDDAPPALSPGPSAFVPVSAPSVGTNYGAIRTRLEEANPAAAAQAQGPTAPAAAPAAAGYAVLSTAVVQPTAQPPVASGYGVVRTQLPPSDTNS